MVGKIRGDYNGLELVDKGDRGGEVSGGVVENKFLGVKNSLSSDVSCLSKAVSSVPHVDPSELFLVPS